jgi:hypothetical protein
MPGVLTLKDGKRYIIGPFTCGDFLRIKRETGGQIDLFDLEHEYEPGKKLIGITQDDFAGLYEVLAAYLEPQFEKNEHNAAKFGEACEPAYLVEAQRIVTQELASFFRALGRVDVATALEMTCGHRKRAMEKLARSVGMIDTEAMGVQAMAKIDKALSDSLSKLPVRSE